nr:MAG TPA: hypothetical protein [Caudoviricetes sp.]
MKFNMLDVYDALLTTCGYVVDENGRVRKKFGKELPVSIEIEGETRYLVLPTRENMTSPDVMNFVFFHPFQENLVRGESRVMSFVRRELNHSYGASVSALMSDIVAISSGTVNHSDLTVEQRKFISSIGKVDERFVKDFDKIINNLASRKSRNTPVYLSLRKGVNWGGKTHSRAAIWSSPLLEEVMTCIEQVNKGTQATPKILGVSVRKGDLKTYENLCRAFFGNIDEKNHEFYSSSDATDAPYCEAFVRSLLTLPKRLNAISDMFYTGKGMVHAKEVSKECHEVTHIDIAWLEELVKETETGNFTVRDWRKEYLLIPLQDGNEGVAAVTKEEVKQETPSRSKYGAVTEQVSGHPAVAQATQAVATPVTQPHQAGNQFIQRQEPVQYVQQYQPAQQAQPVGNQFLRRPEPVQQYQPNNGQYSGFQAHRQNQINNHYRQFVAPAAVNGYVPGQSHTVNVNNNNGYGYNVNRGYNGATTNYNNNNYFNRNGSASLFGTRKR